MAKDDYDVIVYKILLYLYAVLKRKISFDSATFGAMLSKNEISDEYLTDVLRMMQIEGQISGAQFVKAWGNEYILVSNLSDISITAAGINYLKENSVMQKIGSTLKESAGIVASLINIVKPWAP